MRRVIYLSSAVRLFDADALVDLLTKARTRNQAADLSGLLIYHDGSFLQVLEGPSSAVERTMAGIRRDPSHTGVVILSDKEQKTRLFPDWSMGFVPDTALTVDQLAGFTTIAAARERLGADNASPDKTVEALISSFVSSFRELEPG